MAFRDSISDGTEQIREKLDYPQLVFIVIKSITTAPNAMAKASRVEDFDALLTPWYDDKYDADIDKLEEKFTDASSKLNFSFYKDRQAMSAITYKRAEFKFRMLLALAGRVGLLGEKRVTQHISAKKKKSGKKDVSVVSE